MSDDLVKRLRDRGVCSLAHNSCRNDMVCEQAADRIEALTAKLAEAEAQNKRLGDMYHKRGNDLAWTQRQLKKSEARERDAYARGFKAALEKAARVAEYYRDVCGIGADGHMYASEEAVFLATSDLNQAANDIHAIPRPTETINPTQEGNDL